MMQKNAILLSPGHPSLLETISTKIDICGPVIVNQDLILIDGYRRYQAWQGDQIPAVQMNLPGIYWPAFQMNLNTRDWDEIDSFLWSRWAESLNVQNTGLSGRNFPAELIKAPTIMLSALADRKLLLGQVVKILQTPVRAWPFFIEILSSKVRLNVNETASFIDMTFDLANRARTKNLNEVFQLEPLQQVLVDQKLVSRQRGECLLKAMRTLRYPLYQRKTEELSSAWQKLNLQKWQAKKSLLLEKGVLELTIRARSQEDLTRQVQELSESVSSPVWDQIWET